MGVLARQRDLVCTGMRSTMTLAMLVAAAALATPSHIAHADPGKTAVTWYGHAAFRIDTPAGKVILVDPWVTNPSNPAGKDDLAKITKADLILISHGHFDHVGDAVDIAKRTKAHLVATFDLGNALVDQLGFPKDQFGFDTGGNFGGTVTTPDGEVAITFVPAVHSSGIQKNGSSEVKYGGNPGGFVIAIKNGPTIYHTGDTDEFGDMALIGKYAKIDLMLACIGDHFTMGPERAADAVKLVHPKQVAGMHFGTFPVLTGTPADFAKALKKSGATAKLVELKIDAPITL
jgi:L-ascorbate metabolism protein UlaG (beta-lactamase superfamily)